MEDRQSNWPSIKTIRRLSRENRFSRSQEDIQEKGMNRFAYAHIWYEHESINKNQGFTQNHWF